MSAEETDIYFGRHSKHELGDYYWAYTGGFVNEEDHRNASFDRLIAWLGTVELTHLEVEGSEVGWVFAPESDGAFWFRMFWCADLTDEAEIIYEYEEDAWWEPEAFERWRSEMEQEDTDHIEETTYAEMLKMKRTDIAEHAPMWSRQSHPRASRRSTQKSKDRHAWDR